MLLNEFYKAKRREYQVHHKMSVGFVPFLTFKEFKKTISTLDISVVAGMRSEEIIGEWWHQNNPNTAGATLESIQKMVVFSIDLGADIYSSPIKLAKKAKVKETRRHLRVQRSHK